ncbi:MAG: DUF4153 domain-containing protein [Myxococcales bacterium]|nr:DUF4153 domain-containing protein [Myxococcales bacterium]
MANPTSERATLALVGAAQGLALWLLVEQWPEAHAARAAAAALLTFLAVSTLVFHFAWTGRERGRLIALAVGVGAVYAAVAGWVGWQVPVDPALHRGDEQRVFTWSLALLVTLYVLGPFLQIFQRTGRLHFPYQDLFLHGWNNFFIALVGQLFVSALWLVLLLWGALFDLVGIDFFEDLFSEEPFVYGVTGGAAGFGIALGRESERVIATLRGITLAVFRGLLPLVSFVALIFLATLPFTGLDVLWSTNHASQLLLTWVALTVLFLNAVYQDGSGRDPLPALLRRLVEAAFLAMTVYVAIAVYGLALRIGQYGLTPRRVWVGMTAVVLGGYAFGYLIAVVRRGEPWLRTVRAVNLVVALIVVAIGLLAHTPLLDPFAWSARSQFDRIASGRVPAADFDYGTLYFKLGKAGHEKFERLGTLDAHPEIATIREEMARVRGFQHYYAWEQARESVAGIARFELLAPGLAWPDGLREAVQQAAIDTVGSPCSEEYECGGRPVEIDGRPPEEWIVLLGREAWGQASVFGVDEAGKWRRLGRLESEQPLLGTKLAEALRAGDFEPVPPIHDDLSIDGRRYRLAP